MRGEDQSIFHYAGLIASVTRSLQR